MAKDIAKPRSIKITDALWSGWQTQAKNLGKSLAALIIERMEKPGVVLRSSRALTADPGALAQAQSDIEGFRAARDTYLDKINRADAEIEALTKAGAAKDARIAELERLIAARAKPVIAALRADPSMKAIDTSVHHPSGPVLKSAVPKRVRGSVEPFFKPGQKAALEKVEPAKGKGKR